MAALTAPPHATLSNADPRVKLLAAKMKKEQYRPDALIEILHTAQNAFGYLPLEVLAYIAKGLRLPPSRVFSTVTFYHFFSLKSKGEHTCLVCTGTACYVKGAQALLNRLEKEFGLKPGGVTPDNKLGIQVARCIGACGLAPAVVVDNEVLGKETEDHLCALLHAKINAV
ncbi:MAG: NAD(P)H-dependent oxidoreductase subunit E [Lacibacter sp.]